MSASLADRLTGGIAPAAQQTRRATASTHSCLKDRDIEPQLHAIKAADVEKSIVTLHGLLTDHPETLSGLLYATDPACTEICTGDVQNWWSLCRLTEAAWRAVNKNNPTESLTAGDRSLLRPLAARLRFLVLVDPFRDRGLREQPWLPPDDLRGYGSNGRVEMAFGDWNTLVGRAQEARREWLSFLDTYQSHPLLAVADAKALEAEISSVLFARRYGGAPLVLSTRELKECTTRELKERTAPTAEDRAVALNLTDQHLLPRFRLLGLARLAGYDANPLGRVARLALALLTALALVCAVWFAVSAQVEVAAATAVSGYFLIAVGVLRFGAQWAAPLALRLPAASAFGLVVLVSLNPHWWREPTRVVWACAALGVAALGYLVVEARNHGVGARTALGRSLAVALIGTLHGLLVSVIGLVAIFPSFTEDGDTLPRSLHEPGHGIAVLALATAWCLAVGVFSQVLWDDRPITARLSQLDWRAGGSR